MNAPSPAQPAQHAAPTRKDWLDQLRFMLRLSGVFTLTVFILAGFPLLGRLWEHSHASPQAADYVGVLHHGQLATATGIRSIVHAEKHGPNQFAELEVAPFDESALTPSDGYQNAENGWHPYGALDPAVASLARQASEYAHRAGLTWFPGMKALASGGVRVNLSSGSLKHGEMNRAYLLVCDPEAGRIYVADIRMP